jgi:hypothetical protein
MPGSLAEGGPDSCFNIATEPGGDRVAIVIADKIGHEPSIHRVDKARGSIWGNVAPPPKAEDRSALGEETSIKHQGCSAVAGESLDHSQKAIEPTGEVVPWKSRRTGSMAGQGCDATGCP